MGPCFLRMSCQLTSAPWLELSRVFYTRWTPHPVIVTIRDNRDYITVLLYSYYATITGWGVLLNSMDCFGICRKCIGTL